MPKKQNRRPRPGPHYDPRPNGKWTEKSRQRYLHHLARTGRHAEAAEACGLRPATIAGHIRKDPSLREERDEALEVFRDSIERELHRRAVEGVDKPVFGKDGQVGSYKQYSDRLLLELARRHIPEYRPQQKLELAGQVKATVGVGLEGLAELPPEDRAAILAILKRQSGGEESPSES